ncbi:unnamed protein product [Mesocestoides corti]|uniref:DUF862 domain-containing protein n=1 Tax=Mesocestoides corti TaxID=53468 RepID=A0A0R3UG08_MESCO|nr:unnamed protein product [Mesocestoides corti]
MSRSSPTPESSPVTVNVYDMSWLNEYIGNIGLGVFHTGVEVYSREYCYEGHQFGGSGIFEMTPKDTASLGANYSFKTSIVVGYTDFTYGDVCTILATMEQNFCGDQYHLLRKNCNHFTSEFIEILCGAALPKWINRLAVVSTKLPFIERSIPKYWLTPLQGGNEYTNHRSNRSDNHVSQSDRDRQDSTSSTASLPVSPSRSSVLSAPGEQWRRFQSQVSTYFGRAEGNSSSSTSSQKPSSTSASMPSHSFSNNRPPS